MPSCHHTNNNNNLNEGLKQNHNKTRKRGSSSSSSSSLVRRYRFKRAILVGKKGGSSTPVPMWKTRATTSPSMATQHAKPLHSSASVLPSKDKELSVSARKLAATLWEINDLPPFKKDFEVDQMRSLKEKIRSKEKGASLSRSGLLRPQMSDPSHSPISEEVENQLRNEKNRGKCAVGVKNRLKEARSGLSTSKKLLKVLNQMCLREQQSSSMPLVLALGSELDRVCHQIDQLIHEQRSNQNDIEYVMKRFAEEKAVWKRREREKIHDAIKHVAEELEVEKKLRRQTERLNKKIAKEMASIKASHLKASKELEREKRAKEILEQICDELARGIGEDRAQVEELKRESAKVREEVEKEREMLQLADVLREERVQMKLSEAKYQFEEKNAFLEKLRNELEDFMRTRDEQKEDVSPECKKIKDLESYFNNVCRGFQIEEKEDDLDVGDDVAHEGDDSDDSDLHSIELNMDSESKGYKWSYACENVAQEELKKFSIDKESIGRKSFSEKIQWGSICFNKGTSSGRKRDFTINIQQVSDHFDPNMSIEFLSRAHVQDDKDETQSNRSSTDLQDSMSCATSAQRNGLLLTLQCASGEAGEIALALEGDNLKQEVAARKSGC
ncbi:intracellular protein transport protein USO1 isoform X2 [Abrus precatorius]|uniref:Intracellular protein transport protein USO1 isoform X2 n=1 Tax=Abrus precatorius TaxID=3816 RepID=A0A8B8KUD2_ABRPR|nr:intracellular protein transport protein USO1 isoform X2 [Abrus precatorius]